MSMKSYLSSPDFNRRAGYAGQDTAKFLGKTLGIIIAETAKFIKELLMSMLGKR
ncbi:MAG: hypothetical protein O2840_00735 [bacterium]|nr:hypothetical protein [bacterium]